RQPQGAGGTAVPLRAGPESHADGVGCPLRNGGAAGPCGPGPRQGQSGERSPAGRTLDSGTAAETDILQLNRSPPGGGGPTGSVEQPPVRGAARDSPQFV